MQTTVKLFDSQSGKSIWDTRMVAIPRAGEAIVWEGVVYNVDDVEYIGSTLTWVVHLYVSVINE